MFIVLKSQLAIIFGLCAFLGFLSFKPSEPYLSQYLICELDTQDDYCSGFDDVTSCASNVPCSWDTNTSLCSPTACNNVSIDDCGNSDYDYCVKDSHTCKYDKCYKNFTEDEVNDEIYPWSTYAYLPFLMLLGPGAELFSYRVAILVGICGRLVTRFLLLYGKSIADMQWMQVSYAFGTAAEDVLSAYVFYTLSPAYYQIGTSYIKATSLVTNMAAGIVGDLLVVEGDVSLRVLMWISAVSVCIGFLVGVVVIQPPHVHTVGSGNSGGESGDSSTGDGTINPIDATPTKTSKEVTDAVTTCDTPPSSPTPLTSAPVETTPTTTTPTTTTPTTTPLTFADKLRLFREQLVFLKMAFQSRTLTALVLYWVVGNAVFSTLYDYEVAIYAELNGSNEWNGSVLAIMLVAGTAGALLPTWLKHDVYDNSGGGGGSSEGGGGGEGDGLEVNSRHCLNASDDNSNTAANTTSNDTTTSTSNTTNDDTDTPFTATPEFVVGMRITIAGVLSCINLLVCVLVWDVVFTVGFMALFFATWQYINVVTFARLALALKVAQVECTVGGTIGSAVDRGVSVGDGVSGGGGGGGVGSSNVDNAAQDRQLSSDLLPHTILPLSRVSIDNTYRISSTDGISMHNPLAIHTATTASTNSQSSTTNNTSANANINTTTNTASTTATANGDTTAPTTAGTDIPDPPYSVALVTIIALNVVVQIVLQAITFSGLALPLRTSCTIFVLVFCVSTVVYVAMLVVLFGVSRMRTGLQNVLKK